MDYLVLERQTLTINPIKPGHFLRQGRPLPKKLSQDQVGTLLAQVTNPIDHALDVNFVNPSPVFCLDKTRR
jgi:site-specific recombinase XerC